MKLKKLLIVFFLVFSAASASADIRIVPTNLLQWVPPENLFITESRGMAAINHLIDRNHPTLSEKDRQVLQQEIHYRLYKLFCGTVLHNFLTDAKYSASERKDLIYDVLFMTQCKISSMLSADNYEVWYDDGVPKGYSQMRFDDQFIYDGFHVISSLFLVLDRYGFKHNNEVETIKLLADVSDEEAKFFVDVWQAFTADMLERINA